jgi:hypothetical protein
MYCLTYCKKKITNLSIKSKKIKHNNKFLLMTVCIDIFTKKQKLTSPSIVKKKKEKKKRELFCIS